MHSPSSTSQVVRFGVFEVNLRSGELRKAGVRIKLNDQPFQVLAMLLEVPGELVTREDIRKNLWPADTFVDFDHGLNNAVNRVREALGDSADSPRYIETLPRKGYRFIASVQSSELDKAGLPEQRKIQAIGAEGASTPLFGSGGARRFTKTRWQLPLLAVLLAIAFAFAYRHKTSVPPSRRSFILPPDGANFNLIGDSGGSVVISPNGSELAFVAVDSKGAALIWVRPLGSLQADVVPGSEGASFPFWAPDGNWLGFFAQGKLKKIRRDGGTAITLCDAPFGRGGSWSLQGTIVFAPASHSPIYKISDSGGAPVPITKLDTSLHTTHRWPKFLPDGRYFIYLAASHFAGAAYNGVYLGSIDGGEPEFLVHSDADAVYASGHLFFLRNDGLVAQPFDLKHHRLSGKPRSTVEKVLYDSSIWKSVFDASDSGVLAYELGSIVSGTQLRWIDRAGKQLGTVGDYIFQFEPRLSRDGRLLAEDICRTGYEYGKVWVYDLARGVRAQITLDRYDAGSPVWFPDGSRILFGGKRDHYAIYEVDSGGSGPEQLVLDTGTDTWPLDVSPDSRFLLYGQGENVGRARAELWIYPLSRKVTPYRLLRDDAVEVDGRYSPDGRWIAYSSNESGRPEIYIVAFQSPMNSTNAEMPKSKSKISTDGGEQPKWRRDGKELYYLAPDNTMMAVSIIASNGKVNIGLPRPLFRANPLGTTHYQSTYDVAGDGSRFLVNTAALERSAPITLVENWQSDFLH